MKKYIYCFIFLVMLSMWGNVRKAQAYSVSVEENGVYAKASGDCTFGCEKTKMQGVASLIMMAI